MTKLAPEWVRTSDPVIRSPARYRWTMAPAFALVALSSELGTAGSMVCSTLGLPGGHGDGLIAPQDVPAVFGTNVCTTVGVDRDMAVCSPDSSDSTSVHPMEWPTLEGASVAHTDDMFVRLDGTVSVCNCGITTLDSPLIAVARPDGFARTYDFGSDSPDFLNTVMRRRTGRCRRFDVTLTRGRISPGGGGGGGGCFDLG